MMPQMRRVTTYAATVSEPSIPTNASSGKRAPVHTELRPTTGRPMLTTSRHVSRSQYEPSGETVTGNAPTSGRRPRVMPTTNAATTTTLLTTVPSAAPATPQPSTKMKTAFRPTLTTAPPARNTIAVHESSAPMSARLPTRLRPANGTPNASTRR